MSAVLDSRYCPTCSEYMGSFGDPHACATAWMCQTVHRSPEGVAMSDLLPYRGALNLAESTVVGSLSLAQQRSMVADVRAILRASPLVRPVTPNGLPMRVRVSAAGRLGWVGDGEYRYSTSDSKGRLWPEMPQAWRALASAALAMAPDPTPPAWDSAIINWYEPDASLGWHRDQSEADLSLPIVTFSLGDACSWAVKLSKDDKASRTRLESGAVTVLSGRTRSALHTVERIIAAPMFSPLDKPGRLSVTIRCAGDPT